jgi:hypothetical protein
METSDQLGFQKDFPRDSYKPAGPDRLVGGQNQFMHPPPASNLCLSMLEMQWTTLRTEIAWGKLNRG